MKIPGTRSQWPRVASRSFCDRTTSSGRWFCDRICNQTSSYRGCCLCTHNIVFTIRVVGQKIRVNTHTRVGREKNKEKIDGSIQGEK